MINLLLLAAIISSGPMTLERAKSYADACRAYAVREKAEAAKELKAARMDYAKARRYGGEGASQAESNSSSDHRQSLQCAKTP